ncbi:hypothetical protein J122_616 [Marinobacter excellens LAMA 842]|uniref:Glycosyltransferase subfamily 4-like N-terminal domain-containing protein n=1 Tax=Marinobacter excellens LAMA 842 TaxID=1306954 RepID=A0A137SH29_9GAMM|nr:hypothetical protein J122_616 [Marinobacter excellens LAMA 842]
MQRLVAASRQAGVNARVQGLAGCFPRPDQTATNAMQEFLTSLPDNTLVVLDGLAMGAMPDVLERHRTRLQLVALVHHPLADETGLSQEQQAWFREAERQSLAQVSRVVTTSEYTARRVQQDYGVPSWKITTAQPAVDALFFQMERDHLDKPMRLLCVGHLSPRKAQHQLVDALATLQELPWQCTLVGAEDRDPDYALAVRSAIARHGLADRIQLLGELSEPALEEAYRRADLFVFPSLYEGYGMVIDEALAAGLPVLSSDGGALALTTSKPGARNFPAGNVKVLASELCSLLTNTADFSDLARRARAHRSDIRQWSDTTREFLGSLGISDEGDPARFSGQWLEAREPADHAARSRALTDALANWLTVEYNTKAAGKPAGDPLHLVDIGSGRGSNPVYLIPRLPVPQRWTLIEPDQHLLGLACRRVGALDAPAAPMMRELTPHNLDELLPEDATLVTASALIDLVSEHWLRAFSSAVVRRRAGVLVVISYSGHFELAPSHASDALVQELVNQHQHGDKGSGAALGPEATGVLEKLLREAGYTVTVEQSQWHLSPGQGGASAELITMLMTGWADAACQQNPAAEAEIRTWLADRQDQLARYELRVVVDHLDLLGLPDSGLPA